MIVHRFARNDSGQRVSQAAAVSLLDVPGRPQAATWVPLEVELISRQGRTKLDTVDVPDFDGRFLVVKDAALPQVADQLAPDVEFLALRCHQEPLTLVNILTVVDGVDEEASEIRRFPDGRVKVVDRFAFRPDAVPQVGVFRVPQSLSLMFCTATTAMVLRGRVTGLNLQPVWEG